MKWTGVCAALALSAGPATAQETPLDMSPNWEFVADTVMGGVSRGGLRTEVADGRQATWMSGRVSLDNNGGFIQMAFDLAPGSGPVDVSAWTGIEIDLQGNGEVYELRLKTDQLRRPWQSFRHVFRAPTDWTTVRVPFADLDPYRTEARFDPARLRRIAVVAVGRAFVAEVGVAAVRFYRAPDAS